MEDSVVIPRINSSMFREYRDRIVRVVGQVLSTGNNNTIFLTTSDQGNINVTVNHMRAPYENSRFVEVIGQVTGDDSITETSPALSLGDNFDLESYNKLIQYQRKFTDIF
ncbi:replication factor A protein 3 [Piromyces finnis]|uniref:Replication factor A protein 3 n=1 Tax=Piromyces finnis TaxID=1754191 RepID=A0A1Y1VHF2_9FUNG|nr:replication factor A protein 3 [Piromyces finnis]|eukprot:ORX56462.1 replication factor A protein 3 [Piromyces finnis]